MPQSVFIQVGQCGNQIGCRFWDLALQEYQHQGTCIEDMSNFFKITNSPRKSNSNILDVVKARAVLIDMEEGVISELFKGSLKHIFDRKQLITDVSGSGNNWAVGNRFYGLKYRNRLIELFRKEVEECDSLQCFFLLHSMGGGTGSGLGTAVVEFLSDEFPKIPRFVFAAFPSLQDDVITSPYNTVLANSQLINYADCVFPFQNNALIDICNKAAKMKRYQHFMNIREGKLKLDVPQKEMSAHCKSKPFDEMNDIIANVMLNLTCSSRFPGSLNVDINDIIMNMTPYPRLHYLIPSISPLSPFSCPCNIDQMFSEAFSTSHHLFQCPLTQGITLASALLCRGRVSMSDVQFNIEKLKGIVKFVPWNANAWKIGLCSVPHVAHPYSVLMLSNRSSISKPLSHLKESFQKMYRKKAHLHHFLEVEYMEKETFESALYDLTLLIDEYRDFELLSDGLEEPRLNILL